jgi:hypothetical protein
MGERVNGQFEKWNEETPEQFAKRMATKHVDVIARFVSESPEIKAMNERHQAKEAFIDLVAKGIDVDVIAPIEAISKLYELRRMARELLLQPKHENEVTE